MAPAAPPSVTSARTSVYHTANESDSARSSDPASPLLPFWTPAPQRIVADSEDDNNDDGDTTPRAAAFQRGLKDREHDATGSSPVLLERYMDAHNNAAAGQPRQTQPLTPATPAIDTPATRTRLQERLREFTASQAASSSARSTPVPASSARRQSRQDEQAQMQMQTPTRHGSSPLVQKNMLIDVSSQSPSYPSHIRSVVSQVVASLERRGRTKEGRALKELYKQSFKDPGTAELLDALLRQRASERQRRDFVRYVEDVDRMERQAEVSKEDVVEMGDDAAQEDLSREVVVVALPPGFERLPSPRVVIEVPAEHTARDEKMEHEDEHELVRQHQEPKRTADEVASKAVLPRSRTTSPNHQLLNDEARALLPSNHERSTTLSSADLDNPQSTVLAQQTEQQFEPQAPHNKRYKTLTRDPLTMKPMKRSYTTAKMSSLHFEAHGGQADEAYRKDLAAKRRRKKSKKRLFAAANGPVFSKAFKMP